MRAHRVGALVLVDGAQSVPHFSVDLQNFDCDFFAFSGHKILGLMGVGVLWARQEILDSMPPYQAGSNMAHDVEMMLVSLAPCYILAQRAWTRWSHCATSNALRLLTGKPEIMPDANFRFAEQP